MGKPKRMYVDHFQNGGDGIPYHIVVQYREEGNSFMCANCFGNYKDAEKFIEELNDNRT